MLELTGDYLEQNKAERNLNCANGTTLNKRLE